MGLGSKDSSSSCFHLIVHDLEWFSRSLRRAIRTHPLSFPHTHPVIWAVTLRRGPPSQPASTDSVDTVDSERFKKKRTVYTHREKGAHTHTYKQAHTEASSSTSTGVLWLRRGGRVISLALNHLLNIGAGGDR